MKDRALEAVGAAFLHQTGRRLREETARSVSGGCIHRTTLLEDAEGGLVFLKCNDGGQFPLFEAERRGLELLREAEAIRVPGVLASGRVPDRAGGTAFLALEGLELVPASVFGNRAGVGEAAMGEGIAALHGKGSPDGRFGAGFDNFIGSTPQANPWTDSWGEFFAESRLRPLMELSEQKGLDLPGGERLLDAVRDFLNERNIRASLLHGDLWGGNVACCAGGEPVVFDPAAYFGDAEADIAFTGMFGGFGRRFHEAYRAVRPEPEDAALLHRIYNLYHLLNHHVLFGGGYGREAADSAAAVRMTLA